MIRYRERITDSVLLRSLNHLATARISSGASCALIAVAVALAFPADAGEPEMQQVALEPLDLALDRGIHVVLPLSGVQKLEIDFASEGVLNVTWASGEERLFGPPWRYRRVPARGTVAMDFRQVAGWSSSSQPLLRFDGTGRVILTAIRAVPSSPDPETAAREMDRGRFWAPESIGHTTINLLTPPLWSAEHNIYLPEILAGVFAVATAAAFVLLRNRKLERRLALTVAIAVVVTVTAANAHFIIRMAPLANLEIRPDDRIAANYSFAPEFGALAALARRTLAPAERVGVMGFPEDWFSPPAMCFNLAPRPCVRMNANEAEHYGISKVTRLSSAEVDAIVSYNADAPLPAGFVPVAQVSARAFIARRR